MQCDPCSPKISRQGFNEGSSETDAKAGAPRAGFHRAGLQIRGRMESFSRMGDMWDMSWSIIYGQYIHGVSRLVYLLPGLGLIIRFFGHSGHSVLLT